MYRGSIKCNQCEAPLAPDSLVCPYCSAVASASDFKATNGKWINVVVIAVCALGVFLVDQFTGTHVLVTLWNMIPTE